MHTARSLLYGGSPWQRPSFDTDPPTLDRPPWIETLPVMWPVMNAGTETLRVMWPVMRAGTQTPLPGGKTNTCENISLPQTSLAGGKNWGDRQYIYQSEMGIRCGSLNIPLQLDELSRSSS